LLHRGRGVDSSLAAVENLRVTVEERPHAASS
jgi:hypothetical protein